MFPALRPGGPAPHWLAESGRMVKNDSTGSDNCGSDDDVLAQAATTWFVRMTSDTVDEPDRRAFQAWLEHDPAHRAAYAEAENLWRELGGIPDPRSNAARQTRPARDTSRQRVAGRARQRWRPRPSLALAASLVFVALVGLASFNGADRLRADHWTAVGETRELQLADGSIAHLNTDTAVALDYTEACRCLRLLRGEAFFSVTPDAGRPFRVAAGAGHAEALGTAFNVRDADETVTVAVSEGRVRVSRRAAGRDAADSVVLAPGETARYAAAGPIATARQAVARLTAWQQGKLVFADRPLREVVAELDRYRPGAILVLDSAIAGERFTGVVALADTDRALAAIEATLPVNVVRLTPWLTLLRAGD